MNFSVGLMLIGQLRSYRVEATIGAGSFGQVFRGDGLDSGHCAIKVLHEGATEEEERRFVREIKIASRLDHPNIVPILDWGRSPDGRLFCVMPEIPGGTLLTVIARRRSWGEIVTFVAETAAGLAVYHQYGGIHRDLKLENILVGSDGRAMLADFGVAACPALTGSHLTTTACGTEAYMAPEVWQGKACAASDVYALGIVLSELVNGRRHDVPARPPQLVQVGPGLIPLQQLYDQMTAADARKRPTAADVERRLRIMAAQLNTLGQKPKTSVPAPAAAGVGFAAALLIVALIVAHKG